MKQGRPPGVGPLASPPAGPGAAVSEPIAGIRKSGHSTLLELHRIPSDGGPRRFQSRRKHGPNTPHAGWKIEMENREVRAALDRHWAASDANDFEAEHQIYREDAVLEY